MKGSEKFIRSMPQEAFFLGFIALYVAVAFLVKRFFGVTKLDQEFGLLSLAQIEPGEQDIMFNLEALI